MVTTLLTGIYTLTPTHCGTGQTSGAVDLPIAREAHTRFPILPASGLKGAARSTRPKDDKLASWLFGPELKDPAEGNDGSTDKKTDRIDALEAGSLVLLEGRLLLYPLRSLQHPFLYATCPLILERLARDLRAFKLDVLDSEWLVPDPGQDGARVSDASLAGKTLVVEDLVYEGAKVGSLQKATALIDLFSGLLPNQETETRKRLAHSLVVLPDNDFADVLQRAVPVQARIKLDRERKTTSAEGGNLWYEEALPPDCLFGAFATERRIGARGPDGRTATQHFGTVLDRRCIQIGGNETVGEGFCWWTALPAENAPVQQGGTRG
jgi:CRISPR-associated protein Cmr4